MALHLEEKSLENEDPLTGDEVLIIKVWSIKLSIIYYIHPFSPSSHLPSLSLSFLPLFVLLRFVCPSSLCFSCHNYLRMPFWYKKVYFQ